MKKLIYIFSSVLLASIILFACSEDFLDRPPLGGLDAATLATPEGADAALVAAYSMLDGWENSWAAGAPWESAANNWVYGGVASDDAYKGTDAGDQTNINPIERYNFSSSNPYFRTKWRVLYEGISRSNAVIRLAESVEDLTEVQKNQLVAEARFLRGHYHFDGKKMWNMIPFVDETATTNFNIPNDKDVWPMIEADFQFAYDNLPVTQTDVGRSTKYAAAGYLAKAHMFQNEYAEALPLLNEIINSGLYALNPEFHTNFRVTGNNSQESLFDIQFSVNDGEAESQNGNYGNVLNYPYGGGPGECCGFYQPTQNLVNAYQVDPVTGLPLLDSFNDADVTNDQDIPSDDPFVPHTGPLDPRLDWTVGRRDIAYLDWGPHPGSQWIRDQSYGGPYSPKKHVFYEEEKGTLSTATGWAQGPNANNYSLIRYADILLMAAEAEVEVGSLSKAMELVNMVRERAANPDGFVLAEDGTPAANYQVGLYTSFPDKEYARNAVRFERRLELAMEGHRFFDLVRYGEAASVLNEYLAGEQTKRQHLQGAQFTAGVNEFFPIPFQEIVNSMVDGKTTLTQNPGY